MVRMITEVENDYILSGVIDYITENDHITEGKNDHMITEGENSENRK